MLSACIAYRSSARAFALLANSLCISSLAPVRSHAKRIPREGEHICLCIDLVTLFPPPSVNPSKQGIPTAHLHTKPHLTNFFPSSHLPTSLATSHTTTTTPIRALQSNTAFSRTKKEGPAKVHAHSNTDTRAARVPKGFGRPLTQGHTSECGGLE